ncbi:MAG: hypothetical protein RL205_1465 [Actinomycetota bacterium]|jgi:Trk K+ transport system NAD-binding subunit
MSPLSGHIVVFGFHGVGRRIVRQLSSIGHRVLVIDSQASLTEQEDLQRWGITYLAGYGDSEDTLSAASVTTALAVLCVTDDDVRNTRLALLVRDRSAEVRIVVRIANSAVSRALHEVAQPGAVLDVAALASPSFVETVLDRTTHELNLGGVEFIIDTISSRRDGMLRSLGSEFIPLAVRHEGDSSTTYLPADTHPVRDGDSITVIGTRQDYRAYGIEPETGPETSTGPNLRRRLRELVAAMNDAVDRPFRIAALVLATLFATSFVILISGYQEADGTRMDPLDAIYFTSETIATVGFGDFYFRDQPTWLRLWAVALILLGAALVAIATALLTNALVTRRLEQSLGRQRLTGMRDHIVVIGLGSVGSKVAADLRAAGHEVAVIDSGDGRRLIPQMRAARIPVLIGDATLAETQVAAGIERAAGVAILTSDDLVNIEMGLAVRGVIGEREVPIALRVFSRNLARVIGSGLDAGVARSIAELAMPWFVGETLGLEVLGTFYLDTTLFLAIGVSCEQGGRLEGVRPAEAGPTIRVVAIRRAHSSGTLEQVRPTSAPLTVGDRAYIVGPYQDVFAALHRG